MREYVARLNIAHYRDRLKKETDPQQRENLAKLLSEQEAELKLAIDLKKTKTARKDAC